MKKRKEKYFDFKDFIFLSLSVKCISCIIKCKKKTVTYGWTDRLTYRQSDSYLLYPLNNVSILYIII